ncbi:hypothetical protein J3P96_19030 [Pseudomonas sp. R3-56]|uniref:hypothetical protein n=1 Tax=Pseudomonas sp. R3-56 TaxID=2817401 RepID=UPI003DAA2BF2
MSKYTRILCEKDFPERHLENHLFGLIADNLRFAEKKLLEVGTPVGHEKDFNTLLRAVAKARSVAAINDSLIRQRTIVPNVIEGDVDLDGLKDLTARNTQRLIDQVEAIRVEIHPELRVDIEFALAAHPLALDQIIKDLPFEGKRGPTTIVIRSD